MATNPDPPVYALGMDLFVPNDCVREKPDWASLTLWAKDKKPEAGGMPLGIQGVPIVDHLLTAFIVGRKRATNTDLGISSKFAFGDCFVKADGGTKNVLVKRLSPSRIELRWSLTLSAGYILAMTAKNELVYSRECGTFKRVDLANMGYGLDEDGVWQPYYPQFDITRVAETGYDEAYLFGDIGPVGAASSRQNVYRVYIGERDGKKIAMASQVRTVPPAATEPNESFFNYLQDDFDNYLGFDGTPKTPTRTGHCGVLLFRLRSPAGFIEEYAAYGGIMARTQWSTMTANLAYRLYRPKVISPNRSLVFRQGVDRVIPDITLPPSPIMRCILSSTVCYTDSNGVAHIDTFDIASTSIQGETFVKYPTITPLGGGLALIVMPRVWRAGFVDSSVSYNAGFVYTLGGYWAIDVPIDVNVLSSKCFEIAVTDGVNVAPLFRWVDYNRDVKVIPIGHGKALIFFSRRAGFAQGTQSSLVPELHYFNGNVTSQLVGRTIHPDVEGFCIGDGMAVFLTGQTDTSDPPRWYLFKNGSVYDVFTDPFVQGDVFVQPMTQHGYIGNGVGIAHRLYSNVMGVCVGSYMMVLDSLGSATMVEHRVNGGYQMVINITPLDGAAIITSCIPDPPDYTPPEYHYSYLSLTDAGPVLTYMYSVDNFTPRYNGTYIPPTIVRVSERSAVIQTNEGVFEISPGSTAATLLPDEKRFKASKLSPPKTWSGDIWHVGPEFIMFMPSDVRDLRPGTLASRGEI